MKEREGREFDRVNEILHKTPVFPSGGTRRQAEFLVGFIDQRGETCDVEPIGTVSPIALSIYHRSRS